MKIILIYTPRSGSTSIFKYFEKLKPDYLCFNEPWFEWMQANLHKKNITYNDVISNKNVFVKSTYKTLPVSLEQIIKDFDKVFILLRKNKEEQIQSYALTEMENSYLNYEKRTYNIPSISNESLIELTQRYDFLNEKLTFFSKKFNIPLFFYEDLYYGNSFPYFFSELGVKYDQTYFDEYLNINKRYKEGEFKSKKIKTLF